MAKREDLIKQFGEAEEKTPKNQQQETLSVPNTPTAKPEAQPEDKVTHHGGAVKRKRQKIKKKRLLLAKRWGKG